MANAKPTVYDVLDALLNDCLHSFSKSKQNSFEAISTILLQIQKNLHFVKGLALGVIGKQVGKYDVAPDVPANGYRSLISLLESLLSTITKILKTVSSDCSNFFFRANEHLDKLELCSDVLHQIRALLYYSQILMISTPEGDLFLSEKNSVPLMHDCELMAKACFYGSLHGFQYVGGAQAVMQSFLTIAAQYSDLHQFPDDAWNWLKSAVNSGRYVISPELRSEKLEKLYNSGDVEFMRKLWFLPEQGIAQTVPSLVGTGVQINLLFKIPPKPLSLHSFGDDIEVPACRNPVRARLVSYSLREGQGDPNSPSIPDAGFDKYKMPFADRKALPKSRSLVFFCHGGGFVSLTSKSFELILRDWSKALDCPIFCVDYSLAPESPFPEAFEECFYAYAWALKHCHFLGSTAERIVFAGDSAGGNLITAMALRCGVDGLRMPDSLVAIYPALVVSPSVSPARLLSVMDPILPLGVLSGCLSAYAGVQSNWIERKRADDHDSNGQLSPSLQPMKMKYLSNLKKDLTESLSRIRDDRWKRDDPTWWDEQFHPTHSDVPGDRGQRDSTAPDVDHERASAKLKAHFESVQMASCSPDVEFKITLPHAFLPLKSKFYGDHFKVGHAPLAKNAYMSPILASDDMLRKLPQVHIVACEFDPLLDDSVAFAKRMAKLEKPYSFHLVEGLPHGFLSFQFTKEAIDAAALCLQLIQRSLIGDEPKGTGQT